MIGGLIMAHGDDAGLRLPPRVAPVQVIVVAVKDAPEVPEVSSALERELSDPGMRVARSTDGQTSASGADSPTGSSKVFPFESRSALGTWPGGGQPRSARDREGREAVAIDQASQSAAAAVESVHTALLHEAAAALERRTLDVSDLDAAIEAARDGFARLPWAACGPDGERRLNHAGISVRCLTRPDGAVPESLDEADLMAVVARAY